MTNPTQKLAYAYYDNLFCQFDILYTCQLVAKYLDSAVPDDVAGRHTMSLRCHHQILKTPTSEQLCLLVLLRVQLRIR